MHKISTFLKQPLGRYLIVGGSAYVLEIAVIIVAQQVGTGDVVAVALSFTVGLIVSFVLQKFYTFGDKRTHHKVILSQVTAVCLLIAFNFGFTLAVTSLLVGTLPAVVSRTLAIATTTIWNFYLYKSRIFSAPIVD
jgi:putative flippase GtrA